MAGVPLNPYLMQVNAAAFDPTALAGQSLGFGPPSAAPQQVMLGAPNGVQAPLPSPPPAPAGPPPPPPDPTLDEKNLMSRAPPGPAASQAPPPAPSPAPAPAPASGPGPLDFPLMRVGGGGVVTVPEKETEMRGPTLRKAQAAQNQVAEETIGRVRDRAYQVAAVDYGIALEQERAARSREMAAAQSVAERDDEMQQRQADFDQSVKALSKMSVDPDRFWNSRSTGQKIAGFIGIALGALAQGVRGGPNMGLEIINKAIDQDIKAQEDAWHIARDTAGAKQTAFSMAMQKYGSVDAARNMARAAALDTVAAQIAQAKATEKNAAAQNYADEMLNGLMSRMEQQYEKGIVFMPARQVAVGSVFVDPRTGLTYNEAQAREVAKEYRGAGFDLGKIGATQTGEYMRDVAKAALERDKKQQNLGVTLPNGDTVVAPNEAEAGKLRELAVSQQRMKDLAQEAKQIRSSATFRTSPEARARLGQIQSDMVTQFGVQNKLGALSDADMKLAVGGTADLFAIGPAVEARLDRSVQQADASIHRYVKTIPGAPGSAKGEMPSSFTPHGKK